MKRIVWVEKLRVVDIPLLAVRAMLFGASVKYDERAVSKNVSFLLRITGKTRLKKLFEPAHLSLNKTDSQGRAIMYRLQKDMDTCLEKFCDRYKVGNVRAYRSMVKAYLASLLAQRMSFAAMVEAKRERLAGEAHELFFLMHPANGVIRDFYRTKGFVASQAFSLSGYAKIVLLPVWRFAVSVFTAALGPRVAGNIVKVRQSVWVEYEGDTVSEATRLNFWRDHVRSEGFDLVMYLDRPDTPISRQALAYFDSIGFKWIDCRNVYRSSRMNLADMIDIVARFFRYATTEPFWFHLFKVHARMLFYLYKALYSGFNVKVLIQHQELSWIQQIQVDALDAVGGIMVGFHCSAVPFCVEPAHLTPQHVYFVWGKAIYDWVEAKGHSCRYILPSGLWIDCDARDLICKTGFSKEAKFIISVFDSSAAYNIHQSPDTLDTFYCKIADLLERMPGWNGIIKSKNWSLGGLLSLPSGSVLMKRFESLVSRGKLIFMDPASSPVTAAAHADICVCYGINSAGLVAGACGYRAVHWDCSGWTDNPLHGDESIVFSSLSELESALIRSSKGDPKIGDFGRWRSSFNYFADQGAANRVGKFIQCFMENISARGNAKESLEVAVNAYVSQNNIPENCFVADNKGAVSNLRSSRCHRGEVDEIYNRV